MPFHDQLVEVRRLGGVHGLQGEVVEDEYFDAGQGAHLGFDAVVQPGRFQRAEHLVGAHEPHGAPSPDGDVPEGCREMCLADADRAEDQRPASVIEKPQRAQLVPQLAVVADRAVAAESLQPHARVELGRSGA
jgi:hypothetical protein